MIKKTLLASALTVSLALGAQGVQANPVNNLLEGLFNNITNQQLDARRGGGARRTSSVKRTTTTTSSSSTATKSTTPTSTTAQKQSTTTNTQPTNTTQQNNAAQTNTAANQNTGMATNQAAAAPGGMGMGSTFVSSLAGAGAGVLLANMLLSPSAAAAQGTEVATPDMLSDEQIKECLAQLETDVKDAEERLANAAEDEKLQISEEISQMHNLQATLMKEQINRLMNQ